MRALVTSVSSIFALVVPIGLSIVWAQQDGQSWTSTVSVTTPPPGLYRTLTLWEKIKLSSAYYTRPELVENLILAYSFDASEFEAGGKDKELYSLAVAGKIAFGFVDKTKATMNVLLANSVLVDYGVRDADDLKTTLEAVPLRVLSSQAQLLGKKAEGTVVKSSIILPSKAANSTSPRKAAQRNLPGTGAILLVAPYREGQ